MSNKIKKLIIKAVMFGMLLSAIPLNAYADAAPNEQIVLSVGEKKDNLCGGACDVISTPSRGIVAINNSSHSIVGLSAGTTKVTVTCNDNLHGTKTLDVKVVDSRVKINKTDVTLYRGSNSANSDTVKLKLSRTRSNDVVTWESDNSSIATVNSEGRVVPVKAGNTTVKAKISGKEVASCRVSVIES